MPVQKIKREKVQLSLPVAAYNSVKILAKRENKTVNNYVQTLVERGYCQELCANKFAGTGGMKSAYNKGILKS